MIARRELTAVALMAALVACTQTPPADPPVAAPTVSSTPAVNPEIPTVVTRAPTTAAPVAATVRAVTIAELGPTWRPGCPVGPDQLRNVEMDYVGFDGAIHRGDLVVHQDLVDEVIEIFGQLQQLRYPIQKMVSVANYPAAEDELSMQDNNTSAFNCRDLPGSTAPSEHSYGRAIDINPLINPYLDSAGDLQPKTAGEFLDRGRTDQGMMHAGDPAVLVFTDRGWTWGGNWRDPIDYQHFEAP